MLYLDTSLVVALVTHEPHSGRADRWFRSCTEQDFAVSPWVRTELSAALSAKIRLGALDSARRDAALAAFTSLCAPGTRELAISHRHFSAAARLAARPEAKLSGSDALHLALVAEHGATLCTLDKRQADAAIVLSLAAVLV